MLELKKSQEVLEWNIAEVTKFIPIYAAIISVFEELHSKKMRINGGVKKLFESRLPQYPVIFYSASHSRIRLEFTVALKESRCSLNIQHRSNTRVTGQLLSRIRKCYNEMIAMQQTMLAYREEFKRDILEYNRLEFELSKLKRKIYQNARITSEGKSEILSRIGWGGRVL